MYKNTWQKACLQITHSTTISSVGVQGFFVFVQLFVCLVVLNKIIIIPAGFDMLIRIQTVLGTRCSVQLSYRLVQNLRSWPPTQKWQHIYHIFSSMGKQAVSEPFKMLLFHICQVLLFSVGFNGSDLGKLFHTWLKCNH